MCCAARPCSGPGLHCSAAPAAAPAAAVRAPPHAAWHAFVCVPMLPLLLLRPNAAASTGRYHRPTGSLAHAGAGRRRHSHVAHGGGTRAGAARTHARGGDGEVWCMPAGVSGLLCRCRPRVGSRLGGQCWGCQARPPFTYGRWLTYGRWQSFLGRRLGLAAHGGKAGRHVYILRHPPSSAPYIAQHRATRLASPNIYDLPWQCCHRQPA